MPAGGWLRPVFLYKVAYFVQAADGCKLFLVGAYGLHEADNMTLGFSLTGPTRAWRRQEVGASKPWVSTKPSYSEHEV